MKRTLTGKSGMFFFPYILEIQIIPSLAETADRKIHEQKDSVNQHNES